jgi:molybdate transport system substrate-binding protein
MRPFRFLTHLLALVILALAPMVQGAAAPHPTIAAAANLKYALEEVARDFERDTGHRVTLVFGSSGNFATQILNGAPFQMFLSADEAMVQKLHEAGKTRDAGRVYAMGRIGLFLPHGSPLRPDASLADLGRAAADGRLKRFAIANPEHAPYGVLARQAMQAAGVWGAVQPRLVLGENLSQAAKFAASGSAQGGIIALSLARAPELARRGRFVLIPESGHPPLRQRMVLMKNAGPVAEAFDRYIATPRAQATLRRYGFALPPAAR